jgi:hypothetical protein
MAMCLNAFARLGKVGRELEQLMVVARAEMMLLENRLDEASAVEATVLIEDEAVHCAVLRLRLRLAVARGERSAGERCVHAIVARYQDNDDHKECVVLARALLDAAI